MFSRRALFVAVQQEPKKRHVYPISSVAVTILVGLWMSMPLPIRTSAASASPAPASSTADLTAQLHALVASLTALDDVDIPTLYIECPS